MMHSTPDAERPVALITGASRGIGAAASAAFATAGYDVAIAARSGTELEAVGAAAAAAGARVEMLVVDLTDLAAARTAVDRTEARFGRIDVLVNNAAHRELGTMRTISQEEWDRTLRICLTVPAFVARWVAAIMERRGSGVILNVSSIMSQRAAGTAPAYVAAKGGLDALTYELAALYGPRGIRVIAINPGSIDTEADPVWRQGDHVHELFAAHALDMIPLGRFGGAAEIANTLVWVASEAASYISGTRIVVDGGRSTQLAPYGLKRKQFPDEFP